MKIYGTNDKIQDAVEAVVKYGVAIVEGTKTPATDYAKKVIDALEPYGDICPSIGYQNVLNEGYLYYVYDLNRFQIGSKELEKIIQRIDAVNA